MSIKQDFYADSLQHLQDELKRLDLQIEWQVKKMRAEQSNDSSQEYRGLYISDNEIDEILKNDLPSHRDKGESKAFENLLTKLNKEINSKTITSLEKGIYLSLIHLANIFALSTFETDCILIALAPELDMKYGKLFAYLQDDITKRNPTINLFLKLLCISFDERTVARSFFSAQSPFIKYNLLIFTDETNTDKLPLISRSVKVDDRIVDLLLESTSMDKELSPLVKYLRPDLKLEDLMIPAQTKEKVLHLMGVLDSWEKDGLNIADFPNYIFYLKGPKENGQQPTAEAICAHLGLPLLVVDVEALIVKPPFLNDMLYQILREVVIQSSALYFNGCDFLFGERENQGLKSSFLNIITDYRGVLFLDGSKVLRTEVNGISSHFFTLDFPLPAYPLRKQLWEHYLNDTPLHQDLDISALTNSFRFSYGQIKGAVKIAKDMALSKTSGDTRLTRDIIHQACRSTSNQKLTSLATKIDPHYQWQDIVLPKENLNRLQEICKYVKYRHVVYDHWGFDKKLSLGKGLNALFHGPSGTGKTMAAEVIGNDLGLDLYKIDLSNVVSKYIGETEKNLNKIFTEAETSNAIIFFDEADALFGKRSEVKDAHDRYANIEVAYLLQKMEEYEGTVVLATNFIKNIDEAFTRRMHFAHEFPFPDESHRKKIWQTIFPKEAPRNKNIDFDFLAKKFKIAGGNIKNIILRAAFFAAENSGKIGMKHLMLASKREFQKMGKLYTPSDFGDYYTMIVEE